MTRCAYARVTCSHAQPAQAGVDCKLLAPACGQQGRARAHHVGGLPDGYLLARQYGARTNGICALQFY